MGVLPLKNSANEVVNVITPSAPICMSIARIVRPSGVNVEGMSTGVRPQMHTADVAVNRALAGVMPLVVHLGIMSIRVPIVMNRRNEADRIIEGLVWWLRVRRVAWHIFVVAYMLRPANRRMWEEEGMKVRITAVSAIHLRGRDWRLRLRSMLMMKSVRQVWSQGCMRLNSITEWSNPRYRVRSVITANEAVRVMGEMRRESHLRVLDCPAMALRME